MSFDVYSPSIRSIDQDEAGFYIHDGIVVAARAGLEITPDCPAYAQTVLHKAFANGWIKLVANVKDNELVWEHLS